MPYSRRRYDIFALVTVLITIGLVGLWKKLLSDPSGVLNPQFWIDTYVGSFRLFPVVWLPFIVGLLYPGRWVFFGTLTRVKPRLAFPVAVMASAVVASLCGLLAYGASLLLAFVGLRTGIEFYHAAPFILPAALISARIVLPIRRAELS